MGNIELKTYAGANVTPQNDAIMNDANTINNGIYYGCNVTIKDATTLHITAGQGIIYGRVFEVVDSDISVSLSSSGTLLGQLFVRLDLGNISSPAEILVDTGASLTPLVDDDQINIDAGITEMQLATFKVNTITLSDLAETFESVQPIRAVIGDADISAIGDGSVKGAIRTINTHLNGKQDKTWNFLGVGGSADIHTYNEVECQIFSQVNPTIGYCFKFHYHNNLRNKGFYLGYDANNTQNRCNIYINNDGVASIGAFFLDGADVSEATSCFWFAR